MLKLFVLSFTLLTIASCAAGSTTPRPSEMLFTPTDALSIKQPVGTLARPTIAPTISEHTVEIIEAYLLVYATKTSFFGSDVVVNQSVRVVIKSAPGLLTRREKGYSYHSMDISPAVEMQFCTSFDDPCQLTGSWIPFAEEREIVLPVQWIGPRTFWAQTQYRDATGAVVPIDNQGTLQETERLSAQINGILDERTPISAQPTQIQTAIAATRQAYPVTGSVSIMGGHCCVSGIEGRPGPIPVDFAAQSPFAPVVEMRTKEDWVTETEISSAAWVPFVPRKRFMFTPPTFNWYSFRISVQYRDAKGNLSPLYYARISVEGMPAPITPTP
jgi:hypothetical protein